MAHDNLTAAWRALQGRAAETRAVSRRALRDGDPARGSRQAREAAGLSLDFSRQRIDEDGLRLLSSLADAAGLRARIEAMWRGEAIDATEGRAVHHDHPAGAAHAAVFRLSRSQAAGFSREPAGNGIACAADLSEADGIATAIRCRCHRRLLSQARFFPW